MKPTAAKWLRPRRVALALLCMALWLCSCVIVNGARPGGGETLRLTPQGQVEREDGVTVEDYEVQGWY